MLGKRSTVGGERGEDAWHPRQLSYVLSLKELIQNYKSSIMEKLFLRVINRTRTGNFSFTTWENLQGPCSYTWLLLNGATQSGLMPSSSLAAGCMHGLTDR